MLVLTRRLHEELVITIGDQKVVVRVVGIARDRVRLGITAPREVAVHRSEVAQRIAQEEAELAFADQEPVHA